MQPLTGGAGVSTRTLDDPPSDRLVPPPRLSLLTGQRDRSQRLKCTPASTPAQFSDHPNCRHPVIQSTKSMRIFILGAGATGSLLARLLERQGHIVWCGDRDPERARRFLGKRSAIPIAPVNARNLRAILRAAKGCQLIVNATASVFNQIVLRAALRLRANYLDLSSHLTKNPFKAEQFAYTNKFEEKRRTALINAGAAPGLTNLLVKRAADMLDEVQSVHIRIYESSESEDPFSQWSA